MIIPKPSYSNGRYANVPGEQQRGFLLESLFMYCASWWVYRHKKDMKTWVAPALAAMSGPSVTWLGHAGVLVECGGIRVLIDPVFFNLTPFFRRIVSIEHLLPQLPPIDLVLISHNHWDHADRMSLQLIASRNPAAVLCVPQGDHWWASRLGFSRVVECLWGDVYGHAGAQVTFLPAHHWSQCTPFNRNQALWGSWMIQAEGVTIYHGGDTAPSGHFEAIGKAFPSIDLACLPIGPCEPRKWLAHSHMGSEDAGKAAQTLAARALMPIHWGTYWFGIDSPLLPVQRLQQWASKTPGSPQICAPRMGEAVAVMPQQVSARETAGLRPTG